MRQKLRNIHLKQERFRFWFRVRRKNLFFHLISSCKLAQQMIFHSWNVKSKTFSWVPPLEMVLKVNVVRARLFSNSSLFFLRLQWMFVRSLRCHDRFVLFLSLKWIFTNRFSQVPCCVFVDDVKRRARYTDGWPLPSCSFEMNLLPMKQFLHASKKFRSWRYI